MDLKHSIKIGIWAGAGLLAFSPVLADSTPRVVDRDSVIRHGNQGWHSPISPDLTAMVEVLREIPDAEGRRAFAENDAERLGRPVAVLDRENHNLLEVYVHLQDTSEETLELLRLMGVQIDIVSVSRPVVQGFVHMDRLEKVASLPAVLQITRPEYGIPTAGSIVTEGDFAMGTNLIRASTGVQGEGTTVAVFSNGLFQTSPVQRVTGQFVGIPCNQLQLARDPDRPVNLETELPIGQLRDPFTGEPRWAIDCTNIPRQGWFGDIEVFPTLLTDHSAPPGQIAEGSAIMEIVRDIAPGARLLYGDGRTTLSLEESRRHYGLPGPGTPPGFNPFNIDVIVDNMVFTGTGRYDGSSAVSRDAVSMSQQLSAPYFVSVGGVTPNFGGTAPTAVAGFPLQISGFFNGDPRFNVLKTHSWNPTASVTDRDEALLVAPSPTFEATLVWDDVWSDAAPRATIDLDMYLVPRSTMSLDDAIASSTMVQNGSSSNPVERIFFSSPALNQPMALVIVNKSVDQSIKPFFTLTIERGIVEDSQYLTHPVPLNNADAPDPVMSVGNIDLGKSILGNRLGDDIVPGAHPLASPTGGFMRWYVVQEAPTVVSYSSVSTRSIGTFTGPSAAVGHMAGFAALLRHRYPGIPAARIRELLTDTSGLDAQGLLMPPLAIDLTPQETRTFANAPRYLRPNPRLIFLALEAERLDPYQVTAEDSIPLVRRDEEKNEWTSDWIPDERPWVFEFDVAEYLVSDLGLEIKATSDWSHGSWSSPPLTIIDADGNETYELRADRVYLAEARIGTRCANVIEIPEIQLRLSTHRFDEQVRLNIGSFNEDVANAPDSVEGKVYRVFYQPSSAAVARDGAVFHMDVLSFNPDKNVDCSVILREFTFTELPEIDGLGALN